MRIVNRVPTLRKPKPNPVYDPSFWELPDDPFHADEWIDEFYEKYYDIGHPWWRRIFW